MCAEYRAFYGHWSSSVFLTDILKYGLDNQLILYKIPFKILKNENCITKIGQIFLEIAAVGCYLRNRNKSDKNQKMFFRNDSTK